MTICTSPANWNSCENRARRCRVRRALLRSQCHLAGFSARSRWTFPTVLENSDSCTGPPFACSAHRWLRLARCTAMCVSRWVCNCHLHWTPCNCRCWGSLARSASAAQAANVLLLTFQQPGNPPAPLIRATSFPGLWISAANWKAPQILLNSSPVSQVTN